MALIAGVLIVLAGIGVLIFIEDRRDRWPAPCTELPTASTVTAILERHADVRLRIEQLGRPDSQDVVVHIETLRCPGKADLVILYNTWNVRGKIKKLIGNTFFGVPYQLVNI